MENQRISCKPLAVVTARPIELVRADAADYFTGYAAVFHNGQPDTEYRPLPNVREIIARNAFDAVLRRGDTVEAWYNHSPEHVLASTASQTLFLSVDDRGLKFTIPYDDSDPDHEKVRAKLRKGIATGASFQAMGVTTLQRDGSGYLRTITEIESLREVSIVNNPAYKGTEAMLRAEIAALEKTLHKIARARLL